MELTIFCPHTVIGGRWRRRQPGADLVSADGGGSPPASSVRRAPRFKPLKHTALAETFSLNRIGALPIWLNQQATLRHEPTVTASAIFGE
jgi:hypothetical protein